MRSKNPLTYKTGKEVWMGSRKPLTYKTGKEVWMGSQKPLTYKTVSGLDGVSKASDL